MSPYLFLAATVALTVASQALQKRLALDLEELPTPPRSVIAHYLGESRFWIALALLGAATVAWLVVLDLMPVSKAYTLLSVNYVLMLPVSKLLFEERIPATRWTGVAVIVAGVICTTWS